MAQKFETSPVTCMSPNELFRALAETTLLLYFASYCYIAVDGTAQLLHGIR